MIVNIEKNVNNARDFVPPDAPLYSTGNTPAAQTVPIANIVTWSGNPRTHIDDAPLQELAESLKRLGLLCPLTVRPFPQDEEIDGPRYQIVAGERRFRAAKLAGLLTLPVIVRDVDNVEALMIAVAENDERVDVNPLDRARSYKRLQDGGMKQEEIARSLNRGQPWVSAYTRLLELPDDAQKLIASGSLTMGHAKALFRFRDFPAILSKMAALAVERQTSVRELENDKLPFSGELVNAKAIVRLQAFDTAFDVRAICKQCPLKAYLPPTSWGEGWCLRPDHYHELNEAAKQQAQQEAQQRRDALMARAVTSAPPAAVADKLDKLDRAGNAPKTAGNGAASGPDIIASCKALRLSQLEYNEYTRIEVERNLPRECTAECACRAQALDNYGKLVDVCLQPGRMNSLKGKQSRLDQQERKERFAKWRAEALSTHPARRRTEGLILLVLPRLANIRSEVRRAYAAHVPQGKFRALLEGDRFFATSPTARDALAAFLPDEIMYHARNLVLLNEMHEAYDEKSDSLPQLRYFLGLDAAPEADEDTEGSGPISAEELEVETDEVCADCGMDFTADDLGQAYERRANGVRELENGLCVTPDGTVYCTGCAHNTQFCATCGKTGDEGARFGDDDVCEDCRHNQTGSLFVGNASAVESVRESEEVVHA